MYRYEHSLLPLVYNKFFYRATDLHSHQARNLCPFYQPYGHSNTQLFSVRCTGAFKWNEIPLLIRQLPCQWSFKRKLRSIILDGHN